MQNRLACLLYRAEEKGSNEEKTENTILLFLPRSERCQGEPANKSRGSHSIKCRVSRDGIADVD